MFHQASLFFYPVLLALFIRAVLLQLCFSSQQCHNFDSRLECVLCQFVYLPVNNNNRFSLFHNSHGAETPQTTSVMIYIASVHRKRFVYLISLNQPKYTVDDQGSARPRPPG